MLLLPSGVKGPAFLALPNHYVIRKYNNSTAYALAVGLIADGVAGRPPLVTPWPVEPPLSLDQRKKTQMALKAAGFERFPTDLDGFLKLCQALKAVGKPAGFAFGKAPSDGNSFLHWLLWAHGAKVTDEGGRAAINSAETLRAIDYARALYASFIRFGQSALSHTHVYELTPLGLGFHLVPVLTRVIVVFCL